MSIFLAHFCDAGLIDYTYVLTMCFGAKLTILAKSKYVNAKLKKTSLQSVLLLKAAVCVLWSTAIMKCGWSKKRYRALGPELIPVYRLSTCRWLEAIHPPVGCHYFLPGLQLPSQPKSVTAHRPVPNYTAWWQRHMRVSLPKAVTWKRTGPG